MQATQEGFDRVKKNHEKMINNQLTMNKNTEVSLKNLEFQISQLSR